MPPPVLIDLTHTSHTAARTGVQRVARGLWRSLGAAARPITFDPYQGAWRPLQPWELRTLAEEMPSEKRKARWPLSARLRGWLHQRSVAAAWADSAAGLIVPELFGERVGRALPALFQRLSGPKVALFHDATALRLPEFAAPKTVARLPGYLTDLLNFDGVAAVSASARSELIDYWKWLGVASPPPVEAIPLGIDLPNEAAGRRSHMASGTTDLVPEPQILCVSTIEGRKNHIALLDACESLWKDGLRFRLRLVGARHATGKAALERIAVLRGAGRPLAHDGAADEAALEHAYAAAAFTVYPSLAEGFGLPVAESLARGIPCVCSRHGAVGEIAAGGGCLTVEYTDATSLREAIARLLQDPAELSSLAGVASRRRFKTTADHARELLDWMSTLLAKPKIANV